MTPRLLRASERYFAEVRGISFGSMPPSQIGRKQSGLLGSTGNLHSYEERQPRHTFLCRSSHQATCASSHGFQPSALQLRMAIVSPRPAFSCSSCWFTCASEAMDQFALVSIVPDFFVCRRWTSPSSRCAVARTVSFETLAWASSWSRIDSALPSSSSRPFWICSWSFLSRCATTLAVACPSAKPDDQHPGSS